MTGYEKFNYDAFHEAATTLRRLGHVVISPAEAFGGNASLPTIDYARYDIHALLQVDSVVLLDGWGASTGACTEVAIATWLGLSFFALVGPSQLIAITPDNPLGPFLDGYTATLELIRERQVAPPG